MQQTIPGQARLRSFDQVPIVELPNGYVTEMPTFHARMALEHGPIFRRELPPAAHKALGRWLVCLIGPEANRCVMHEQRDHFSHETGWTWQFGPLFERGLLNMDEPEHGHDRRIMSPAFTTAYMNRYLSIMQRVIEERTRDWGERGQVDLHREARRITFDVVAEALLGFDTGAEVDRLRELFYYLTHAEGDPRDLSREQLIRNVKMVRRELDARLLRRIAMRRTEPTDDLLGMLASVRNQDGEPFTDGQLLGHVHILFTAGHETTTTLAAWTLYLLSTHPAYRTRIEAELETVLGRTNGEVALSALRGAHLLGNAINEAARLHSPIGYVPRGVVKDVAFGGYLIPAGTYVLLSLAGCHRLPHIFAQPDVFDPDRFAPPREEDKHTPYALVPFGGGPRVCLGINFAQVEIKALVAHLLRRYSLVPLEGQNIVHAYYAPNATLVNGIHVGVQRRCTVEPLKKAIA